MAGADVIRDAAESVVAALRAALPAALVAPERVRLATQDLRALPEPGRATITVFVNAVSLRHRLTGERETAVPAELSLVVTPWSDDPSWELVLLRHLMVAVARNPLVLPPHRSGSFRDEDTLRSSTRGWTTTRRRVFLGINVPSRPSLFLKAQVFSMELGAPATGAT